MHLLIPGVSRNVWREHDPQSAAADAEYRAKRPGVLVRKKHTCQHCSVLSLTAMEVHHRDCNHANNADENLDPACVFCHPVNHLGELAARFTRVDQSEVAGGLIHLSYLPEISQTDLSHLLRTIGHVLNNGSDEQKQEAAELYEQLQGYSHYIEKTWGSSKASHFAIALRESSAQVYESRDVTMAGIRVIFAIDAVKRLASRFSNEFVSLPMKTWGAIFERRKPQMS